MMQTEILEALFFNTDLLGYIGPFAVVVACFLVMDKNKGLGLVCFLFEVLLLAQYFPMLEDDAAYIWHIGLIFFGGLIPLLLSGLSKR